MTTHRNHYVPQWYQRRFLKDSKTRLYYLDLTPARTILQSGEEAGPPALHRNSPRNCFWGQDLYTTVFGNLQNDEIERFLFGAIDNDGANALRAVVGGDLREIHDLFHRFFEYLDAQKLRTPKGLDWIRSNYPQLDQLELMLEMQHLRQMHCTMWLEAVREIVSAEDSEIKFIISDHPVTIYHPDCPPGSFNCTYPNDPDIALRGSQTLFPLDRDHCLILTNLDYAKDTNRADLLVPRENARHFGRTIARIDAWIRTRKLASQNVVAVNHILKSRARRFIAATEEAWLYPETSASTDWKTNGQILLPPKNELWHFGGEIYVGYNDGRSDYQDAYGRTSRGHEYLHKDALKTELGPHDECPCGSGTTYGDCCRDIEPGDRMPWNVYSIRERNLMFMHAIESILGFDQRKSWEDVRRELSDDQVRRIHEAYASLWPKDTNIADLLPRPDERVARAVYVGLIDPRTIAASVIGWVQYFDQIFLLNPFLNAAFIRPEYSPIESPGQYKEQTIKNVALLESLIPFIHAGIVHLVPDPMEFNDTFREMVWKTAQERIGNVRPTAEDLHVARELGKDDLKRMIGRLPDESLRHQLRLSSPELDGAKLDEAIKYIRTEHARDPLALIQPLKSGKDDGQLQQFRSTNFELALFLAQLTGAAIYTDQKSTTNDLIAAITPASVHQASTGRETIEHGLRLRIIIDDGPKSTLVRRGASTSTAFRSALRGLLTASLSAGEHANQIVSRAIIELDRTANALLAAGAPAEADETCNAVLEIDATIAIPSAGYSLNAARRFLIAFGRRKHLAVVPLALMFGRAARQLPKLIRNSANPG